MSWNNEKNSWDIHDDAAGFEQVLPIDSTGMERVWKWGIERLRKEIAYIKFEHAKGRYEIYRRNYINDQGKLPGTWWDDAAYSAGSHGTNMLSSMFGNDRVFSFPKSYKAVADCIRVAGLDSKGLVLDYFAGSASTAHAVFAMNRLDGGERSFILVEQGEYFNTVTKPRVLKAAYSESWKNGKPIGDSSLSVFIKVLKIESYEDALNNLSLKRTQKQQDLLSGSQNLKDDYLINYMLNTESRNSLLSTDDFIQPFDYSMNITTDSAGAFKEKKVDLVETFNYLIGLTVKHIDAQPERGFVTVTGTLPTGESCLVLWRDCDLIDYEGLNKLCDKLAINPADNEFDVVYINGDHNIPTVLTQTAEEGGETRVLKLRQIEPEFLDRMFAEEDV
jgi:adenine-specific DNA-methyltransferase